MNHTSYTLELQALVDTLPSAARHKFLQTYGARAKNPALAFAFSCCFGQFAADRFYVGDTDIAVIKLITLGGLGVWTLVDLFLIGGRARDKNLRLGRELKEAMRATPAAPPGPNAPSL